MRRIAIYGKGGIGKSFVASNLSAASARLDRRVVHIGCDPKVDSTRNLTGGERAVPALVRLLDNTNPPRSMDELTVVGPQGVSCIEAGGPEPGEGCGGMGILKLFQFLDRTDFFLDSPFDLQIYDVLGDVVCGGFVAPMKFAAPLSVVIVVSEEVHSLYAANQVAKAVRRYTGSGVDLAGLVLNRRDNRADCAHVSRFAEALSTHIIVELPRTAEVFRADLERTTIVEQQPDLPLARQFHVLCRALLEAQPEENPPTPLSAEEFDLLLGRGSISS